MEPKKIIAPPIPADTMIHLSKDDNHVCGGEEPSLTVEYDVKWDDSEREALRRHVDEIKDDPDFIALWEAIRAAREAEE